MVVVQQGIVQGIALIGELHRGGLEHDALFHAVALGEGTGGNVADDDLQGHDGDFFHHGLPVGDLLDEVGGHARFFQLLHQVIGQLVVDDALADDGALLGAVERGGVVLVVHDHQIRIVGGKDFLGFSFIELLEFFHDDNILSVFYILMGFRWQVCALLARKVRVKK